MTSQEAIKSALVKIGEQNGYSGEMVEISADLLSYVLYQNQIEVANVSQESSLTTAKLMNSKIKLCMESMYSVYRGYNARVLLNFKSNTFKLYSTKNYSIIPEQYGTVREPMECLFVTGTKNVTEITIDDNNKYYIDLKDSDGHLLSNLSEDIKVTIDGIEYPTTRNFYDHINTPIPTDLDSEELDKIFVLTTMDNGIRLYKRGYYDPVSGKMIGYFKVSSVVKVETFKYTKFEDINPDEYNKITLPATELYPINGITVYHGDDLCTMKGLLEDKDSLPSDAKLGDTYAIGKMLYSYLYSTIENPNYIPDDKNPMEFKVTKYAPLNVENETDFATLLLLLKNSYNVTTLNFKGNLITTSLLPVNDAEIGDVYFINSVPYIFFNIGEPDNITNYGFFNLNNINSSYEQFSPLLYLLWTNNIPMINIKEMIGSTGVLPFSNNNIGDTFILTIQSNPKYQQVLIYRPIYIPNDDYKTPEENPEFINALTFINIGSMEDYSSINGMTGRQYIEEIPKENENAILYNANHSMHTQSSILSNADVGYLFSEYFINDVREANTRLCPKGVRQGSINVSIDEEENQVYIFYIPKVEGVDLSSNEVAPFISKYNSYFISNNIKTYSSQLVVITVLIDLYLDSNNQIMDDLNSIFNQYSNKLTKRSVYTEADMGKTINDTILNWDYDYYEPLIDQKQIYSKISKLNYVSLIDNFEFLELSYGDNSKEVITNPTRIPTSYEKLFTDSKDNQFYIRVPIYYKFNLSVNYKNNYEIVS
jgi:hypothetical protein